MGAPFVMCFCTLLLSMQAQEFQSLRAAITQLRNQDTAAKSRTMICSACGARGTETWSTCEMQERKIWWLLAC